MKSTGYCACQNSESIIIIIIIIIQTDRLISARRPDLIIFTKKKKKKKERKKRTCRIVNIAVPDDHRVKLKESEKKHKYDYLNLARELKKLWNMLVMFLLYTSGALGTVTEGLIKGLEDYYIQTTTLLRSARIVRRVLET